MARSRRNCISMRDVTYIALRLYKEKRNEGAGRDDSITGLGQKILQGEVPPIPPDLLKKAEGIAEISREKRAVQDVAKKGKGETPFTPPTPKGEESLLSRAIKEGETGPTKGEKVEPAEDDPDDKHYGGILTF